MDWQQIGIGVAIPAIAAVVAFIFTADAGWARVSETRRPERPEGLEAPPPSEAEVRWYVAHIRNDIGMLFGAIRLTNALLAAIAAGVVLGLVL